MATAVCCIGCERFVRTSDPECPFCGTTRAVETKKSRRPRVARAAMVAMALASGCGGPEAVPAYGAPPPDIREADDTSGDSEATDPPPDNTAPDGDVSSDGSEPTDPTESNVDSNEATDANGTPPEDESEPSRGELRPLYGGPPGGEW